jgi:A/G-specific adenine glycosylase
VYRDPDIPLAPRLLRWYRSHGRHDLPWQKQRTPYRIWISEIMLQQTQVASVIPYYSRFITRFPEVNTLASALPDEVLHLWSGLGYYARARNLQRAAQLIRDVHGGVLPREFEELASLPGIGRSTAAAILALAHGERHAILDGNVKRVLARLYAVEGWPGESAIARKLWSLAERHTPHKNIAAYTQAIMDLGATVCTRARPRCRECPLSKNCIAHGRGHVTRFPTPRPRKSLPVRHARLLLITSKGRVLLERRPPAGIWGGLWGFPELPAEGTAMEWCDANLHGRPQAQSAWPVFRHTFSHFHLDIQPLQLEVSAPAGINDSSGRIWYDLEAPPRVGLSAPVRKLIGLLRLQTEGPINDTQRQMRIAG